MIRVYNTKEDEVFNIPLTPEAARSPQILSSFMKRSQTLSHDPFFFYTAFHDSCGLSIRKESAVRFHCCGSRTCPQPRFHQSCPVRVILRILLPSNVNQRVPRFRVSTRISSSEGLIPLTAS